MSASCYLHVDDAVWWNSAWAGAGVRVGPIEDRPWGSREFAVTVPSGNLIRVGQNM